MLVITGVFAVLVGFRLFSDGLVVGSGRFSGRFWRVSGQFWWVHDGFCGFMVGDWGWKVIFTSSPTLC